MATNGTLYSNWIEAGQGSGRYRVEWQRSKVEISYSTIVYSVYVDYINTRFRPYSCSLKIGNYNNEEKSQTEIVILDEKAYSEGPLTYPESGARIGGGTFTVIHNSQGIGHFDLEISGEMSSFLNSSVSIPKRKTFSLATRDKGDGSELSGKTTVVLETNWTPCSAPDSVSFWKGTTLLVPFKEGYTITWPSAKNGKNNPVKEYEVYWRFSSSGSAPTTSTYSGTEIVKGTSYKISVPTSERGKYLRVAVRTIGTKTGDKSSLTSSIALPVNQLPSKPQISTKSPLIFPSEERTGTIQGIKPGKANFGSSDTSVYYLSKEDLEKGNSTKTQLKETSLTKGEGTYYFWTYDGKEYSSDYVTIEVKQNNRPEISELTCSCKYSTIKDKDKNLLHENEVLEEITFNIKPKTNCRCQFMINANNKSYVVGVTGPLTAGKMYHPIIKDVRLLYWLPPDTKYTFSVAPYDEIEDGLPKDLSENFYNPPLPKLVAIYNQFEGTSMPGTNPNNFYDKLRICLTYDSYFIKNGKIEIGSGVNSLEGSIALHSNNQNYSNYNFSVSTEKLKPGNSYNLFLNIKLGGSTSTIKKEGLVVSMLPSALPINTPFTIRPYTDGIESKTIPLQISRGTASNFYKDYNLDKEDNSWWKSELIYNGEVIDLSPFLGNISIDGDIVTRNFTIYGSTFFSKLSRLPHQGEIRCILRNTITNLFGQTTTNQKEVIILNFNESPVNPNFTGNYPTTYLIEGQEISFECSVNSYSTNKIYFIIQIDRHDGNGYTDYIGRNSPVNYDGIKPPSFNSPRVVKTTLKTTIKEIKSFQDCDFKLLVIDGNKSIESTKKETKKRLKFVTPTISFQKGEYNPNYEDPESKEIFRVIEVTYAITDPGYYEGQIGERSDIGVTVSKEDILKLPLFDLEPKKITENKGTIVYPLGNNDKIPEFIKRKLQLTTEIIYTEGDKTYSLQKIATSETVTIYDLVPTVTYRKNRLGINSKKFLGDDILIISPTANKKMIRLFQEDSEDEIKIDLTNRQITGIVVDCGEITF